MSRLRFLLEINNETVWMTTNYQEFISRLRETLGTRHSHNVRALVVQSEPPPGFFDVLIETSERSVRFRLRVDNLYLIGYQMLGGDWLEFRRTDDDHLISGSTYLTFDCSYGSMVRAAHQSLLETSIGLRILESAIETLAVEEDSDQERARSLMVVVMMICEATRFTTISELITSTDAVVRIEPYMVDLVRSWGYFSGALFRADAYPDERFMLPDNYHLVIPPNRQIRTLADIITILGVLLGLCYDKPRTSLRLTVLNKEHGQCFVGVPLLQVFSVSVNHITDASTANLTGTIIITNGPYNLSIYNRTKNNPELISFDTDIDLNGPSQTLSAFSNVSLILKLLLNNDTNTFIDATVSLDPFNIGSKFDERISVPLDSPSGSVTVNCAVLRNAVSATVTVVLIQAYESTSEVYGHVDAYYDGWTDPLARSRLFRVRAPEYVSVDRGQNIPLSRSVVAVPLSVQALRVTAYLRDYDPVSADDVIANETFHFSVPDTLPFTLYRDSTEDGGNVVRVIVSWSSGY